MTVTNIEKYLTDKNIPFKVKRGGNITIKMPLSKEYKNYNIANTYNNLDLLDIEYGDLSRIDMIYANTVNLSKYEDDKPLNFNMDYINTIILNIKLPYEISNFYNKLSKTNKSWNKTVHIYLPIDNMYGGIKLLYFLYLYLNILENDLNMQGAMGSSTIKFITMDFSTVSTHDIKLIKKMDYLQ